MAQFVPIVIGMELNFFGIFVFFFSCWKNVYILALHYIHLWTRWKL